MSPHYEYKYEYETESMALTNTIVQGQELGRDHVDDWYDRDRRRCDTCRGYETVACLCGRRWCPKCSLGPCCHEGG